MCQSTCIIQLWVQFHITKSFGGGEEWASSVGHEGGTGIDFESLELWNS